MNNPIFKNLYQNYFLLLTFLSIFSCHTNAQHPYTLLVSESAASCLNYSVVDDYKKSIDLPQHIKDALECAAVADLTNNILTFRDKESIKLFDLVTKKEVTLFTLYPEMDGISNPVWSKNKKKIMFVIINQERKHGYTDMARIISLKLDENLAIQSKRKFDRPVHFVCGGICQSTPYVDFKYTDEGITYKRNENIEDRPGAFDLLEMK